MDFILSPANISEWVNETVTRKGELEASLLWIPAQLDEFGQNSKLCNKNIEIQIKEAKENGYSKQCTTIENIGDYLLFVLFISLINCFNMYKNIRSMSHIKNKMPTTDVKCYQETYNLDSENVRQNIGQLWTNFKL